MALETQVGQLVAATTALQATVGSELAKVQAANAALQNNVAAQLSQQVTTVNTALSAQNIKIDALRNARFIAENCWLVDTKTSSDYEGSSYRSAIAIDMRLWVFGYTVAKTLFVNPSCRRSGNLPSLAIQPTQVVASHGVGGTEAQKNVYILQAPFTGSLNFFKFNKNDWAPTSVSIPIATLGITTSCERVDSMTYMESKDNTFMLGNYSDYGFTKLIKIANQAWPAFSSADITATTIGGKGYQMCGDGVSQGFVIGTDDPGITGSLKITKYNTNTGAVVSSKVFTQQIKYYCQATFHNGFIYVVNAHEGSVIYKISPDLATIETLNTGLNNAYGGIIGQGRWLFLTPRGAQLAVIDTTTFTVKEVFNLPYSMGGGRKPCISGYGIVFVPPLGEFGADHDATNQNAFTFAYPGALPV